VRSLLTSETLYCVVILAAACVPRRRGGASARWLAGWVAGLFLVSWWVFPPGTEEGEGSSAVPAGPRQNLTGGFVTSSSCRHCHPGEYSSWHASFHRTMTQRATPEAVVAPFDGVVLSSHGRTYELQRQGNEFWVRMPDPDWEAVLAERGVDLKEVRNPPRVTRPIVLLTGSHHVQEYWVPSLLGMGNELHQLPFVYRIREQRWIPREAAFVRPPQADRAFPNWNQNCLKCHATGPVPGLNVQTKELTSTVAELGIACEACHGPGEEHVRYHRNPLNRYHLHLAGAKDETIVNPARVSHVASSQICGQCHSYHKSKDALHYYLHGRTYRPGDDLHQTYDFLKPTDRRDDDPRWKDGTVRVGGREYHGLLQSGCFQRGKLSCLSCHSMHESDPNDQLIRRTDANTACTQCHTEPRFTTEIEVHTHHSAGSSGSQCYNCHMPHTSYALLTAIRSHRIDSPRAESLEKNDRLNACNLCHLDKTLRWTGSELSKWYGHRQPKLAPEEEQYAPSVLMLLRGDAAQRVIAAWHYGWQPALQASGDDWQAPLLAHLLDDPYAAVRFVTERSLKRLPGYSTFSYDFLAPRAERQSRVETALQRHALRKFLRRDKAAVLRDGQGKFMTQQAKAFLKQRDDQPIHISE